MTSKFFAVVAGVGPGTGRSVALKFAQAYPVVLLSRRRENLDPVVAEINAAGGRAIGISTDTADPAAVEAAFAQIKRDLPGLGLAAAVFNAAAGFSRKGFLDQTLDDLEASLRGNAHGLFNFAHHALPLLLDAVPTSPHPPSLLITGATASLRGSARFGDFAAGKFAVRALGQSLAREFGPRGVHVAHAIIDGVIDIPRTKGYDVNGGVDGGKIDPAAIADAYWYLHTQPRSHFTQELDVRPFVEKF